MIEAAICSALEGNAALAALVGARIYEAPLPQAKVDEAGAWPAISYQLIGPGVAPTDLEGEAGLASIRIQVDCWAATSAEVDAVSRAVRKALNGFHAMVGAVPVRSVWLAGGGGRTYEPDTKLRRVQLDFKVACDEEDL